jgi:hypothetical protein
MTGPMMSFSGASKEALAEARDTILAIVTAPCGDAVKEAALQALTALCAAPSHMTISDCTFHGPASTTTIQHATPEPEEYEDDEARCEDD